MEVIEPPAKARAAGSIEILGDVHPRQEEYGNLYVTIGSGSHYRRIGSRPPVCPGSPASGRPRCTFEQGCNFILNRKMDLTPCPCASAEAKG